MGVEGGQKSLQQDGFNFASANIHILKPRESDKDLLKIDGCKYGSPGFSLRDVKLPCFSQHPQPSSRLISGL